MSLLHISVMCLSFTLATVVSANPEIKQSQAELARDRQLLTR